MRIILSHRFIMSVNRPLNDSFFLIKLSKIFTGIGFAVMRLPVLVKVYIDVLLLCLCCSVSFAERRSL